MGCTLKGTTGDAHAAPPTKPPPGGTATAALTSDPLSLRVFCVFSKFETAVRSVLAPAYPGSLTVEPLRWRSRRSKPPLGGTPPRFILLLRKSKQTALVPAEFAPKFP